MQATDKNGYDVSSSPSQCEFSGGGDIYIVNPSPLVFNQLVLVNRMLVDHVLVGRHL